MSNLKKFVGEHAYNTIKNIAVDTDALRRALVTSRNAREVFSELSEFETKALCSEISNSGTIGKIRDTTEEEIINAFNLAGYDTVIFDDENAISECQKYYRQGEVICTYGNLQQRMREYHMMVVIKANINKIEPSRNPQRDDEYGTSILNIQIARNGSYMSIKNRYNHTVSQPDSTLNNNLDLLYPGLQSMILGHYGFASLSNKKSYYKNIVNIGDVYLKYHTERNNIYYGAFVLDGVNGVRFTDTSRYYVTANNDSDRCHHIPLVLDFKDKKAIDVSQQRENQNGKVALLSRAMNEGILTNANKEDANILTATFQDAKRELLQSRKNALKYINEACGYDFAKPYKVTGFLGKFTAKTIEKATGSNNGILLVSTRGNLKVCEMRDGRFYAKDLKGEYSYGIGSFYRQGDFETTRKSGNTALYVIQQEKQYIGKPKRKERKTYYSYHGNGEHKFDKSGCDLTESMINLLRRLNKYKREKRVNEAAQVDYTQDIVEITKSFAELKTEIITRFTRAETYKDYDELNNIVNHNLTWLVWDIDEIKSHIIKNDFSSVDSARNMMKVAKDKISKMKEKLT